MGRDMRAGHALPALTYVNLEEVPVAGTSLTESLIMRNLTRFLWLGIARLMGKNIPKRNKTISYQTGSFFSAGLQVELTKCNGCTFTHL